MLLTPRTCATCGAVLDPKLGRALGVKVDAHHTPARCRARVKRLAVRPGPDVPRLTCY